MQKCCDLDALEGKLEILNCILSPNIFAKCHHISRFQGIYLQALIHPCFLYFIFSK